MLDTVLNTNDIDDINIPIDVIKIIIEFARDNQEKNVEWFLKQMGYRW